MKKNFSKSQANFGCYAEYDNKQDQHIKTESFTIDDVLNADVPLKDKAWFIRKNCQLTTDQYSQFAIGCALCVLPIYESKYPDNKAPREAIEAAKSYLANQIDLYELLRKQRAAAAYAAAAAAYAAAAAAAYAAAAAAYAAYAYAAADAAAYAAAAAADDAAPSYKTLLLNFFKQFVSEND